MCRASALQLLLDQWFARGRTGWSPTTVRNLGSIIERHLKPGLGDLLVGDLTAAIVDQFYERLRTEGRIDGKPLAVGTVRRVHSTLRAALAQAQRWSWVFDNVADHASPPRGEPAEMRPPTPAEVARLLEFVADDPSLQLYLTLAATTGARRGQLLALRWTDVDLAARPVVRTGWRSTTPASSSCGPTVSVWRKRTEKTRSNNVLCSVPTLRGPDHGCRTS
jgi:integrase